VEDAETLDEEAVVEIPARSQPTTKPALANQSEDGDKQPKKMNRQVTIIQRDQSNGRCEALDFDYGY